MIYLDSSVALAQLFGEGRTPPPDFWQNPLVSSDLLEYEVWNRVHARGFGTTLAASTSALIDRLRLVELTRSVLARALEPFPVQPQTLDSLHLATIEFLRGQGEAIELASYDSRLIAAAQALGVALATM